MRGNLFLVLIVVAAALYLGSLLRPRHDDVALKGRTRVIDGDTIELAGKRIRIFGIDAPEQDQTCERGGGGTWNCGAEATRYLRRITGSQIVDCSVRTTDVYGRYVARCLVEDEDLGRAMVRSGFAINTSRAGDYAAEQASARAGRLGIWSGTFQDPKAWRDAHRDERGGRN
jgi:endonuclease YncB( thermonuclease family)